MDLDLKVRTNPVSFSCGCYSASSGLNFLGPNDVTLTMYEWLQTLHDVRTSNNAKINPREGAGEKL